MPLLTLRILDYGLALGFVVLFTTPQDMTLKIPVARLDTRKLDKLLSHRCVVLQRFD
jgi:hypothetical protein